MLRTKILPAIFVGALLAAPAFAQTNATSGGAIMAPPPPPAMGEVERQHMGQPPMQMPMGTSQPQMPQQDDSTHHMQPPGVAGIQAHPPVGMGPGHPSQGDMAPGGSLHGNPNSGMGSAPGGMHGSGIIPE